VRVLWLIVATTVAATQAPADGTLRIYLVRHGQTTWNVERRVQGWSDPPLSSEGRRQAARVARRLRRERLDAIYTSPSTRAADTARIIAGARPIVTLTDLRERNFGVFEGVRDSDPDYLARIGRPGDALGDGETSEQFTARVENALTTIRGRWSSGQIAIVGHFGTNTVILRSLLKLTERAADAIPRSSDDVYVIELSPRAPPRLRRLR
jgi:probable phosphoglycerate mutase